METMPALPEARGEAGRDGVSPSRCAPWDAQASPLGPRTGPIGIAGAGRLGPALGRLLREAGETVAAIADLDPARAAAGAAFIGAEVRAVPVSELPERAPRLLIAVSDEAIRPVAEELASPSLAGGIALHTCGAVGVEVLAPLAERGVSCGVLHPLQTIPAAERGVEALRGIAYGVTAEGAAREWAAGIARLAGGRVLEVPAAARALYHAAAVTACNYVVALLDAAAGMLEAADIGREEGLRALRPMVESTVRNVFDAGPEAALTGPIRRGDARTVERHLRALARCGVSGGREQHWERLYRAAGLQALELARRAGLDEAAAQALARRLRNNVDGNA